MMKFLCFFIYFICSPVYGYSNSDDYYWRDFDGTVPDDAIAGGTDENGSMTYIGQVPGKHEIVKEPADEILVTILGNGMVYGAHDSKIVHKYNRSNVKVLCVNQNLLQYFQWSNKIVSHCSLMEGGIFSNSSSFYIGRANYKGRDIVGSFTTDDFILTVPWGRFDRIPNEEDVITFNSFEMLIDCK